MTIRNARRIRPVEIVVLSAALVLTAVAWMRCAPQGQRKGFVIGSDRGKPATPAATKLGAELLERFQAELGPDWKLQLSFGGESIYFYGSNEKLRFDPTEKAKVASLRLCMLPPLPDDTILMTCGQGGYLFCQGETEDRRLMGEIVTPQYQQKAKVEAAIRKAFGVRWGMTRYGLRCRLEPAAQKVRLGEEVKLTLVMQNHGSKTLRLPEPLGGLPGVGSLSVGIDGPVLDPPSREPGAKRAVVELKPGEICRWELSVGSWKLRTDHRQLSASPGRWQVTASYQVEPGDMGEWNPAGALPVEVEIVDDRAGAARTVRVAAVQMASRFADPAANRDKMEKLAREAARGGAKIVVFPEAAVQGYVSPKFELWTDPKRRPGEGKSLEDFAEPAEGESARRFGQLAGELKVHLVVPFIEREEKAGAVKYFNSLLLFGPDGQRLLHYRKINPWPRAEATWAADGDRGLAFVDTEYGRLGLLICYDIHSVAAKLAAEKVDTLLYAIAWVDAKPERWFGERLPDKAKTLGVNIVAANWTFPESDRLIDRGYGYSRIVDRTGKVLAEAKAECGEEVVFAELVLPQMNTDSHR